MPGPGGRPSQDRAPSRKLAGWFLAAGWVVLVFGLTAVVAIAVPRHRPNEPAASTFLVVGLVAVSAGAAVLLGLGVILGAVALPRRVARAPWFVLAWGLSALALFAVVALLSVASCPV